MIRVQSDLTTTLDFAVRETALQLGEITVVAERPPVEPDKTTSKYIMSAEDLESVPIVRDMGEFIELQAGVGIDAEGDEIIISGGDRQDVAYVVDGVRIATTDHRGSRPGIGRNINKSAVQELQVITGGYNAEYGNAQGGVVALLIAVCLIISLHLQVRNTGARTCMTAQCTAETTAGMMPTGLQRRLRFLQT